MDIQGANTFLSGCNDDHVFVDDHDDSIQARSITEHHLMVHIYEANINKSNKKSRFINLRFIFFQKF